MSGALARASLGPLGRQSWSQVPKVSGCVIVQQRDSSNAAPTKFKLSAMKRGTGGRSSFSGIVATVFGASGYLGRYVCNRLGKIGSQIIIPYRCDPYEVERLRMCGDLGQVLFFPFELKDDESLRKVMQYSNVVINLVGRDYETRNFSFQDVHVDGPRRMARIAKEAGVERFIHMSHLNATANPQKIFLESQYLKSKYEGELAVKAEFPEATIFKPTDMYGEDDRFFNYYMGKSRWMTLPIPHKPWSIPLWKGGEQTIKQPVYVSDVAAGIVAAIRNPDMAGKEIQCVGPTRYYLNDICEYFLRILRRDEYMSVSRYAPLTRAKLAVLEQLYWKKPWANQDRFEREHHTDWPDFDALKLEDLGVTQQDFAELAYFFLHPHRRDAYYAESFGEFADPERPKPAEFYQGAEPQAKLA